MGVRLDVGVGTLLAGQWSHAFGNSAAASIVGMAETVVGSAQSEPGAGRAFLWDYGAMDDLFCTRGSHVERGIDSPLPEDEGK